MSTWTVRAVRLDLDPDLEFFRETTAKFLDQFAPPAEIRRLRSDVEGFDRGCWCGAELGWTSLLVTDDAGGGSISGQGIVDLSLVAHEFGAHAAPGPLLPTNVVAAVPVPARSCSSTRGELLTGDAIASWAYSEPAPNDGFGRVDLKMRDDGATSC